MLPMRRSKRGAPDDTAQAGEHLYDHVRPENRPPPDCPSSSLGVGNIQGSGVLSLLHVRTLEGRRRLSSLCQPMHSERDSCVRSESDIGDVPSKRSRPSGSRVSNDENETPPDAEHGAARKQRRTQRGRTATPPLRSAPRRARAASPSDSGTSQESDEDTGYELTRQQEQRAQQQQQTQAHAGGGEEAEEGLGIQRCGSPDNEVRSEEDPASDADDFVPEEARCPSACVSCLLWSSERLIATPMPAGRKSHWRALMLQVLAEEFELRSQGLPGQLDCMRVRATSLHICTCCVVTKLKPSVAGKHYHLTRHDSLRWHSDPCLPPSA